MATQYGVTATGCVIPQLVDIQGDINGDILSTFGAAVDLSPTSNIAQLIGVFAAREAAIWEAYQDAYNSQYPDTAFGASLDNVGAITNIPRLGPISSTISSVKLFGTPGTVVPSTSTLFSIVNQPTNIFQTKFSVTLGAGQNCIQTITFSATPDAGTFTLEINGQETAPLPFNATLLQIQTAFQLLPFSSGTIVTGAFPLFTFSMQGPGTGGLMGQPLIVIDPTANLLTSAGSPVTITPVITQAGLDQGSVDVVAVNVGAIVANINTLTVINTPISGLTQILNVNPSVNGRVVETDAQYRIRRTQSLQINGGSTYNAIVAKLLNVTGVSAVVLFENVTNVVDSNGVPPHGFEAFVQGGDPQTIGNAIFNTKPIGIESFGTNLITVTDSQGNPHPVYYSVPTQVPVYIIARVSIGATYPVNGDAAVIAALVGYGETLSIGQTVIVSPQLISSLVNIPGINAVTLLVGTSPNPTTSNNVTITANQVAEFDPSFIQVIHV